MNTADHMARRGDRLNNASTPGAVVVCEHRAWQDCYRIRTQVTPAKAMAPPASTGPRTTEGLTWRGVRVLSDACEYTHSQKRPFCTFLTLTFDPEARQRLAAGDTTVAQECSRWLDACQKMAARGWQWQDSNGNTRQVAPHPRGKIAYLWVVECPTNTDGEPNPHCHMLLDWRVARADFDAWAARLERIWGHGFAHLEKIRNTREVGGYLLKALGYLTKTGATVDPEQRQGLEWPIRGNRYFVGKEARAPGWETEWVRALGIWGGLIRAAAEHERERRQPVILRRQTLREAARATKHKPHGKALNKRVARLTERLRGAALIPGRYHVTLQGKPALYEFLGWAQAPGHWRAMAEVPWLPEKPPGLCADLRRDRNANRALHDYREGRTWARLMKGAPRRPCDAWWAALRRDPMEPASTEPATGEFESPGIWTLGASGNLTYAARPEKNIPPFAPDIGQLLADQYQYTPDQRP